MTLVIAALDNSLAAQPVLATAIALGELLGAEVEPVHVRTDGDGVARRAAEAAALRLTELVGPPVERLIEAGAAADVISMTLGARGTPGGARPAGGTALAVASALSKPVVLVPPDARAPGRLRRVLVPLERSLSASLAPRAVFELASRTQLEVVALHILDEASLPAFTDQPQHETEAWAREFLARYCPEGVGTVRLETRVGRRDELVPQVAEELGIELIALGWSRELAAGRAPVVKSALASARVPIMLVPVLIAARSAADSARRAVLA